MSPVTQNQSFRCQSKNYQRQFITTLAPFHRDNTAKLVEKCAPFRVFVRDQNYYREDKCPPRHVQRESTLNVFCTHLDSSVMKKITLYTAYTRRAD